MNLVGDEGYVTDRLAAFRDSGVTVLNVQPVGPNGLGHRDARRDAGVGSHSVPLASAWSR